MTAMVKMSTESVGTMFLVVTTSTGGFEGQATDINIHAKEIARIRARLEQILAAHTGQPLERIRTDTERDYFIGAQNVVKYGLIDKVLEQREVTSKHLP